MESPYEIILYYKYTSIANPEGFMKWHKELCGNLGMKGRVLIAKEGINGTLEGTKENIAKYCEAFLAQDGSEGTFGNFSDTSFKRSAGTQGGTAFPKLKVKVRQEVVSLKLIEAADGDTDEDINPNEVTGVHLKPEELKQWYQNGEDFVVVDMRNDYEYKIGHFKDSINPKLTNFRDLPKVISKLDEVKEASKKGKKVLSVCTGGIRCEKASGYLIKKGFENVYQLDGGMHNYMEKYPGEDFLGKLYVFDNRETVDFAGEKGLPREVVGKCDVCAGTTERFTNCANDECHIKMLCCESCQNAAREKHAEETGSDRDISLTGSFIFCSDKCRDHAVSHVVDEVAVA
jgi:UPF0176 protein